METASFEVITKPIADELLAKNTHNRKVRKSRVDHFCRILRRGEWITTSQGISILQNGVLCDGQHRLLAVSKTGIPIRILVCRNIANDSYAATDDVTPRTVSDRTGMHKDLVALVRQYRMIFSAADYRQFTPGEYLEFYNSQKKEFDLALSLKTQERKTGRAAIWATLARYARRDYEKAREFGEDFRKTMPDLTQTRALQSLLLRRDFLNTSPDNRRIAEYCISAMNAHYEGRDISRVNPTDTSTF